MGMEQQWFYVVLKPLQNKKGQKNLGYPSKKQSFYKKKRLLFFSGTPNFFGPCCFEAALECFQFRCHFDVPQKG